ncbi:MAG TPA: transporter substrate-binding domain-containing protein [Burkholderiales bacterium]|nr:transporter substrate-binding domain-containing protein [Burkholderiales bacterium]
MRIRSLLAAASLAAVAAAPAHALTMITEENPPLNFTEGAKLTGYATDVIAEMGRRAKIPLKFDVMAWSKGYPMAQSGKDHCIYSTARLPARELQFQWVGPVAFNRWGVFARKDFAGKIGALDDLKPHRIGAVTFDAKADFLKENSVVNLLLVEKDADNPARLFLPKTDPNHIDLWVTSLFGAQRTAGAKASDLKLVYTIRDVPSWLACSPYVPKDTVGKLAAALASMNQDGTMTKIALNYEKFFAPR